MQGQPKYFSHGIDMQPKQDQTLLAIAQKLQDEEESKQNQFCRKCSKPSKSKCGKCDSVAYCSRKCRKSHWNQHKEECQSKDIREKEEVKVDEFEMDQPQNLGKSLEQIEIETLFRKPPSDLGRGLLAQWKKHGPMKVDKLISDGIMRFVEKYKMKENMSLGTQWYYSGQIISSGSHYNSYSMRNEKGEMNGIGRDWNDGGMYEGEFLMGKYHGYGRQIWTNGYYQEGNFEDGKMNGQGKSIWNGKVQQGLWQDDEFVGDPQEKKTSKNSQQKFMQQYDSMDKNPEWTKCDKDTFKSQDKLKMKMNKQVIEYMQKEIGFKMDQENVSPKDLLNSMSRDKKIEFLNLMMKENQGINLR